MGVRLGLGLGLAGWGNEIQLGGRRGGGGGLLYLSLHVLRAHVF